MVKKLKELWNGISEWWYYLEIEIKGIIVMLGIIFILVAIFCGILYHENRLRYNHEYTIFDQKFGPIHCNGHEMKFDKNGILFISKKDSKYRLEVYKIEKNFWGTGQKGNGILFAIPSEPIYL